MVIRNFGLDFHICDGKSTTDPSCRRSIVATAHQAPRCANVVVAVEGGLWRRCGMELGGRCHVGALSILVSRSENSLGSGTVLSGVCGVVIVGSVGPASVGSVVIEGVDSGIALSRYVQMRLVCKSGEERVGLNLGHCSSHCRLYSRFG